MVEPLLILPGLVVAFLGYYGTKSNVLRIKEVRGLAAAEAKDVRQVRPDSGFVEIEGTAQPGEGETLAAPIANTDALLRVSKLQRWHSSSHDDPGSYHTKDRAVASVPFDVDTNVAIGGGEDPDRMVIADKPESEIESGNLRFAILGLVLSLLFLLAGLGLAGLGVIA